MFCGCILVAEVRTLGSVIRGHGKWMIRNAAQLPGILSSSEEATRAGRKSMSRDLCIPISSTCRVLISSILLPTTNTFPQTQSKDSRRPLQIRRPHRPRPLGLPRKSLSPPPTPARQNPDHSTPKEMGQPARAVLSPEMGGYRRPSLSRQSLDLDPQNSSRRKTGHTSRIHVPPSRCRGLKETESFAQVAICCSSGYWKSLCAY